MKQYEQPFMQITALCHEDIVTASIGDNDGHTPESWFMK